MHEINLSNHGFDKGAYGLVVFSEDKATATKVFLVNHDREHVANVFESEVEAYEVAMKKSELKKFVPNFLGKKTISKIIDPNGNDISDQYFLNMAYKMEYIQGMFQKLGTVEGSERTKVTNLFTKYNINYLKDASVVLQNNTIYKIIDFAIQEHELWHKP